MSPGEKVFEQLCDIPEVLPIASPVTLDNRPKPGLYIGNRPGGKPMLYVSGYGEYRGYMVLEVNENNKGMHVSVFVFARELPNLLKLKFSAVDLEKEFKNPKPDLNKILGILHKVSGCLQEEHPLLAKFNRVYAKYFSNWDSSASSLIADDGLKAIEYSTVLGKVRVLCANDREISIEYDPRIKAFVEAVGGKGMNALDLLLDERNIADIVKEKSDTMISYLQSIAEV